VKDRTPERTPSAVPATAPQDGEIRARWAWVESMIWTERMLATLETGIEGGKWFRLIDRIILGEIRGGEAFDLLQILNTGHSRQTASGQLVERAEKTAGVPRLA
jgi:hypothetical protein